MVGAGLAVSAAVAGMAVRPVRLEPPPAQLADQQAGQRVHAGLAVVWCGGGVPHGCDAACAPARQVKARAGKTARARWRLRRDIRMVLSAGSGRVDDANRRV